MSSEVQEAERLEALHSYQILDSDPETEFDDLVALVARLLEVPVALITLVDRDRQWFKARLGIDATEGPLEQAICIHAMKQDDVLVIPDTLQDARTRDNPLCCGEISQLRFYAGAPLVTPMGHVLGTLCVLDDRVRDLTPNEAHTLSVLSRQTMLLFELRRSLYLRSKEKRQAERNLVKALQPALLHLRDSRENTQNPEARDALDHAMRGIHALADAHNLA